MKKIFKNFCIRGALFAWGGPFILAIIWAVLKWAGEVKTLTVDEVALGIISMTVMAFIAAGASTLYQIENLPKSFAGLIHMALLYIDYLGFYLLNGWITLNHVWVFTLIFVAGFAVIWFIIYITTKSKVDKINRKMDK